MSSGVCGYYGKLPISPEFLRLHAAGPELRWLDDWIQKGMLYAEGAEGLHWATRVAEADAWNFMYVPSGPGRIVCGVIFASRDKAGRSFPFMCFLLLDRESIGVHVSLAPVIATDFLEHIGSALPSLRESPDWKAFNQHLERFQPPDIALAASKAVEGHQEYLRSTTVHDLCVRFWGTFDDPRKYRLETGLTALIRTSRHGKGRMLRGIKVPLTPTPVEAHHEFPYWLSTCLSVTRPAPLPETGMLVFWSQKPKKVEPCALLSMGPGSVNVTRFIVSPDAEDKSWHDILTEEEPPTKTLNDSPSAMNDPNLSVQGLIERLIEASEPRT